LRGEDKVKVKEGRRQRGENRRKTTEERMFNANKGTIFV